MKQYIPEKFVSSLNEKLSNKKFPSCRFCGCNQFTTTDSFGSILIGKDMNGLSLGPTIPTGIIICENCGHIEFFALGALGLLDSKDVSSVGTKE